MTNKQRIKQLEKTKTQGNRLKDYERQLEVESIFIGVAGDIKHAAIARGEPEPEGKALIAEIMRVIHDVQTSGVYDYEFTHTNKTA